MSLIDWATLAAVGASGVVMGTDGSVLATVPLGLLTGRRKTLAEEIVDFRGEPFVLKRRRLGRPLELARRGTA